MPMEMMDPATQVIADLGSALGLPPGLIRSVQMRGASALADWGFNRDETGALGVAMSLAQRLGTAISEAEGEGEEIDENMLLDYVEMDATQHGVNPMAAVRILAPVMDIFQRASGQLAESFLDTGVGQDGNAGLGPTANRPTGTVERGPRAAG